MNTIQSLEEQLGTVRGHVVELNNQLGETNHRADQLEGNLFATQQHLENKRTKKRSYKSMLEVGELMLTTKLYRRVWCLLAQVNRLTA